ncbi:SOS response-associated peptidase [Paenibacillus apiarius]|uniref:SOS response-associated peptidase n=1 Tax=Paenibacillus apiarius TaxID=46240 RepID=UPI00197E66E7|nr:SOS response-associated peptidase [Paenibacillus apiarius]MBN3526087.1 SOS response-associated peptidase [Paenibacillus apiarius]
MCGRFTLTVTLEQLMAYYSIDPGPAIPFHAPRYNIAPSQSVPALIHDGTKLRLGPLKWGLVPAWAKDDKTAWRTINARAETLREKPAFRLPFERKRCIIPADGFYEWKRGADGTKQPMRIVRKDGQLLSMAGLYDTWLNAEGEKISTCTVITTEPNELMASIHDRMPVIVPEEQLSFWLDRRMTDTGQLQSFLRPYPAAEMEAYPVDAKVGNTQIDDPACIQRL